MVVTVLGGNGQLGAACCAEARPPGRPGPRHGPRRTPRRGDSRADVVMLDLTAGSAARRRALDGSDCVILTANGVAPRAGGPARRSWTGRWWSRRRRRGDRRTTTGAPLDTRHARSTTRCRSRAAAGSSSDRSLESPLESWVLRLPPFMETWLALVGSSLPLRGEPHATIGRPSPFLLRFRGATSRLVEDRGVMLVPGPASHRHAFISVGDAARACVEAALRPEGATGPVPVAGPEVLSWNDVAAAFTRVLGRRVRVLTTRPRSSPRQRACSGPFAEAPARTMALNRYLGRGRDGLDRCGRRAGGPVDHDDRRGAPARQGRTAGSPARCGLSLRPRSRCR